MTGERWLSGCVVTFAADERCKNVCGLAGNQEERSHLTHYCGQSTPSPGIYLWYTILLSTCAVPPKVGPAQLPERQPVLADPEFCFPNTSWLIEIHAAASHITYLCTLVKGTS